MQKQKIILTTICLLCFSMTTVFSQDTPEGESVEINFTQPETIDPLNENIGDFLDVDLYSYRKTAFDAYQSGDFEKAARYYLTLLKSDVNDANSIYNLACCYGLLGKEVLAAKYLERSVKAGFDNIEHIKNDPDFDNVRESGVFNAVVDSIAIKINKKSKALGKVIYVEGTSLFKCRIHFPNDYDSTKSYILLTGLHGYGDNLDNFIRQWNDFDQPDFIYVAIQAPYPFSAGKNIGYSWGLKVPDDKELSEKATGITEDYIAETVRILKKRYKISDVYLMGFSQGSGFTYTTGIKNHPLFKGLICFGGWFEADRLPEKIIKAAKELRVFIAHGKDDRIVKYKEAVNAKDVLTKYGYEVTFKDFEGGHTIPVDLVKQVGVWMKE